MNIREKRVFFKKAISVMLLAALMIQPINVEAKQSRSGNFSTAYSLNGSQADKLVAVAQAQVGKTKDQLGYSEAWCADFVSDCAKLAGLGDIIPFDGYCQTLYNKVKNAGGYDVVVPQKGDLVFYYCNACTHWCHVGIMLDSKRSVEGNYGGQVSLVNGAYRDGKNHSLANGKITRRFVRPAYYSGPKVTAPRMHVWVSDSPMGGEVLVPKNGEMYYLCYELINPQSGKRHNSVSAGTYTIKETIYKPDGSIAHTCEYKNSDNNWIGCRAQSGGTYRGVVEISGDFTGKCEVSYRVPEVTGVSAHVWFSDSKMGGEISNPRQGETYYLCYELLEKSSGKRLDEVSKKNYKVEEIIYNPDGTVANSYTYTNDNNWIGCVAQASGEYKGVIKITGDYTGEIPVTFDVPKVTGVSAHVWFSDSKMGGEISNPRQGKTYYLCYELLEKSSGKRLDEVSKKNYKVEEIIYNPDGTVANSYTYTNDNNWIGCVAQASGEYKGVIRITGDYTGEIPVTFHVAQAAVKKPSYYGDLNGDGEISVIDASKIKQAVNGAASLTEDQKKRADLNGDGEITNEDAELIKQYILGSITRFPVEDMLSSIRIVSEPEKNIYEIGEKVDLSGLSVEAEYNNGQKKKISDYTYSGGTKTAGKSKVTISYTEQGVTRTADFYIQVNQKKAEQKTIIYHINNGVDASVVQKGDKNTTVILSNMVPIKEYEIVYNGNGAKKTPQKTIVQAKFAGWYENGQQKGRCYQPGDSYYLTKDVTFYASYTPAKISELPSVEREGYTFDGWYTGSGKKVSAGMELDGNLSLNAHWVKDAKLKVTEEKPEIIEESPEITGKESKEPKAPEPETPKNIPALGEKIKVNGAFYRVTKTGNSGTVEYVKPVKKNISTVTIPAVVKNNGVKYKVASIASDAFKNNKALKRVNIGGNVSKIGARAFYGCKSLKNITIETKKLTDEKMGGKSFQKISAKAKIKVPKSKYSAYKKILRQKGAGSKVKIVT